MAYRIHFEGGGEQVMVEHGESVLEAAVRAGLAVDYGCNGGNCGLCAARLLDGEIEAIRNWDYVFERHRRDGRHFLMCSHTAATDLRIEAEVAADAAQIPLQRFRAKARRPQPAAPDLAVLRLRVSRSHRLRFLAGQEARLAHPRYGEARLAVASCPCDATELEFHIRARGGDDFRARVLRECRAGDWFDVEAPYGSFTFTGHRGRAIALLAWGDGFAAAKSLLEHVVAQESELPIHLYRADDAPPPYYLDNLCCAWRDALDQLRYVVLPARAADETAAAAWAARIADDCRDLSAMDFYLCLPRAAHAARAARAAVADGLVRRGALRGRIFGSACELQ